MHIYMDRCRYRYIYIDICIYENAYTRKYSNTYIYISILLVYLFTCYFFIDLFFLRSIDIHRPGHGAAEGQGL